METSSPIINNNNNTKDSGFYIGLALIALTFLCYLGIGSAHDTSANDFTGFIITNYIIALFYFVMMFSLSKKETGRFWSLNPHHYSCFLTLATISCFSLNETVNVFDNFSFWVDAYVFLMYVSLLGFCYIEKLPNVVRVLVFGGLGLGTSMAAYFTFYLLPLMPFGVLLCFAFGFSLHLIVPLLVFINFMKIYLKTEKTIPEKWAYGIGVGMPLMITILFSMQWNNTTKIIQTAYAQHRPNTNHSLPAWVAISQQLSDGIFTQRILKGDLIYTTFSSNGWGDWGALTSLSEKKEHDPLVAIATAICGELEIDRDDRLKILQFYGNERHGTHRKLWTGADLITSSINSKIEAYPEFRLAYSEHIITIKNTGYRQEEALYSFDLPEGSVASSLSLWVDGVEEPSRLTTRGKADSAYVAIVGVERRDPALLHWQEGNRVTVTVFPCTREEDRIFKIGFTSPMQLQAQKLFLPKINFEGPDKNNALLQHQVAFPTQPNYEYDFDNQGNLTCDTSPLSQQHFSFNNKTFWIEKYHPELGPFDPTAIYLDINKSWTKAEFIEVCELYKNKPIYVYNSEQMTEIKSPSLATFELLNKNNFSLLPIDLVSRFSDVLVISKSTEKAPNLSDLKETNFGQTLINTLQNKTTAINFYSLSDKLSPYLKSLKEFYVLNEASGSLENLKTLHENKQFPQPHPSSNAVVLQSSQSTLFCQSNEAGFESKAPDHLMRLFSYNQLLKKIGRGYFQSGYESPELIAIASEAHIVTPISSMIVLETIKDYERFDIEENEEGLGNASDHKNGLHNATSNDSGAVPEPHEWLFMVLIVLGLGIFKLQGFFKFY